MLDTAAIADAALLYASYGWHVVPIEPRGKKPWLKAWQCGASIDKNVILQWWRRRPASNVGVQLGERSNLVDLECDSAQAETDFAELFDGDPPVCPTSQASRGKHRLFKWRKDLPGGAVVHFGELEVRTGNSGLGAQSVFPPSVHPSGKRYEWLVSPDEVSPPEIPDAMVAKLWNLAGEETGDKPKEPIDYESILKGVDEGGREKAAKKLIGLMLGGVDVANEVAVAVGWQGIQSWNQCNKPPWPEHDLRTLFDSFLNKEKAKRADGPASVQPEPDAGLESDEVAVEVAPSNGRPERDIVLTLGERKYHDRVDPSSGFHRDSLIKRVAARFAMKPGQLAYLDGKIVSAADEGERIEYPVLTAAGLDAADCENRYLIPNILAANQPCIMAAPKKSLKTSIAIDLGVSLATGGLFLGYFHTAKSVRVALMSGESGLPVIQETARRIAEAAGQRLADIDGLLFSEKLPMFGRRDHAKAMEAFIRDNELSVCIIDPAFLSMPNIDAGNLFSVGELLRSMNDVFAATDATLILIHHTRKTVADPFEPPELEDIAWAGFQEFARQWFLLGHRDRYEPGTGEHRLWLSLGGSAGHNGLWGLDVSEGVSDGKTARYWDVKVLKPKEARQDAKSRVKADREAVTEEQLAEDKKSILRVLAKYPAGETARTIRDETGLADRRYKSAMSALLQEDQLTACEIVKRNRKTPYEAYKLGERQPL